MASYSKLISHLEKEENKNFLLIAHERPDGDTIAATLALTRLLESLGKIVTAVSSHGVPEVFRFLPDWQKIKDDFLFGNYDSIILIDNGDLKRTGFLDRIILAKSRRIPIVNIDHHPKNDIWKLAKINLVDETASSTCEIIYELFEKLAIPIDQEISTMLLAGIYTDTGGFQHANTKPKTLAIASKLMSRGAKLKSISNNISNFHSLPMLKLWGIALDRIKFSADLALVYSIITRKDIKSVGAKEDDLAGVVNLISSVPGDKATLLLYELADGKIKGSLRTESSQIDVSRLAALFGGGGHKKASGFLVDGRFEKIGNGWRII